MKTRLDIYKNNLTIRFNYKEKKYMAYLPNGEQALDLNLKSEKILAKKNKELLLNPNLLEKKMQEAKTALRYEKLKNMGFRCDSFEVLYSERGFDVIGDDLARYLDQLVHEDDVLIGIHRTGSASLDDIAKILKYGLVITRLNGSTTNSSIQLGNNVGYYPNNETIIKELINADAYKSSLGSILIRIPDCDLEKDIFMIDMETGNFILDPAYIVGFIPVEKDGHISEIITAKQGYDKAPFKSIDTLYDDRDYARNLEQGYKESK